MRNRHVPPTTDTRASLASSLSSFSPTAVAAPAAAAPTAALGTAISRVRLIPPTRRLRAGAAGDALLVAAAHLEPLLGSEDELAIELGGGVLAMYEVAEAAADTALARVKATAGLAEVGDGAQLAVDGPAGVPAAVELVAGLLGRVLVLEPRVHVADQVVVGVVAHDQLLQLPVLAQLAPQVLVEGVEVVHALLRRQ
ncbi:hypothetical protein CIB48_g7446, partial [Xylaria polymorpha]